MSLEDDLSALQKAQDLQAQRAHDLAMRKHNERLAKIQAKAQVEAAKARNSDYQAHRTARWAGVLVLGLFLGGCWITHDSDEVEKLKQQREDEFRIACLEKDWEYRGPELGSAGKCSKP